MKTLKDIRDAFQSATNSLRDSGRYTCEDDVAEQVEAIQALDTIINSIPDGLGDAVEQDLIISRINEGVKNFHVEIPIQRFDKLFEAAKLLHNIKEGD